MSEIVKTPGSHLLEALQKSSPSTTVASLSFGELLRRYTFDVQNRFYKDETIHLDGYTFTNCGFKNCTLITNTGVFTIDNCTFMACSVSFGVNAIRVMKLFHLFSGTGAGFPTFSAQTLPDGSVTIR
jgi:hypothetical protein